MARRLQLRGQVRWLLLSGHYTFRPRNRETRLGQTIRDRGSTFSSHLWRYYVDYLSDTADRNSFRGLLSVHSRYGLHARGVAKRPFPSKAPTALLPPLPFRLLPGGANQFPGGSFTH
jgi:hypothetical protein